MGPQTVEQYLIEKLEELPEAIHHILYEHGDQVAVAKELLEAGNTSEACGALAEAAAPVRDDGEMQAAVARVSQLAEKDLHEKETMVAVIDMIDREEFDRAERALAAYKAQIMSKAELIAEAIAQVRMAKEREVFQWTGG